MPALYPFRAVRPSRDKVHLVGSRSYVTYTQNDLEEKLKGNPYSFLHIIRPELDAAFHDLPRTERFGRIREEYEGYVKQGILLKDLKPGFYYYEQTTSGRTYSGFIGAIDTAEYNAGNIKVHEQTLERREQIFAEYLDATRFNAEPVLLVHDDDAEVETLREEVTALRPEYEFTTTDKVYHALWLVEDPAVQHAVTAAFARMDALYIADGHHRSASSARLSHMLDGPDGASWHRMMALCLPASRMAIFPFHRLVRTLGCSPEELLEGLKTQGQLEALDGPAEPECEGVVHVYLRGQWYRLTWPASEQLTATQRLDAARLSRKILGPVLGIGDLRKDRRIDFMGGPDRIADLQNAVDSGQFEVAFALCAVPYYSLKSVADEGGTMPPKSTFVEPKLRSGITIFELES